ncbi:hypothetical protein J6590_096729 [Homalodisca vitripennis]|nr:hypothetical protein J6590_096729 [Homalodisca vitripennis]
MTGVTSLTPSSSPSVVTVDNENPEHKSRVRETQSHITPARMKVGYQHENPCQLFLWHHVVSLRQWFSEAMGRKRKE